MRIVGNGGGTPRQDGGDKVGDPKLGRLDVHVGVYETWSSRCPIKINGCTSVTRSPTHDGSIRDRDVGGDPLLGGRHEEMNVLKKEITKSITTSLCEKTGRMPAMLFEHCFSLVALG